MTSWRAACLAVAVCAAMAMPMLAQGRRGAGPGAPVRDGGPASTPAGSGEISGRVTSAEGAPMRRAQVQLTSSDGRQRRTTTTDGDGRYSFSGLPAGRYAVRVSKGGFVDVSFGQTTVNGAVPPIILGEGESLPGLNVVLPRGSAITGRVTDEFGDPVLQAQVQALRLQYQPDGQHRLVPGGAQAVTDDLGQFRLYGLQPGEYVVSATSRNAFGRGRRGQQDDMDEGYAPIFYPGTTNPAEAQTIPVGIGQELSVQLQLVPSPLSRISGVVVDSQGRPAPRGTTLMLRAARSGNVTNNVRSANVAEDGSFALTGVPAGDYLLEVRPRPAPRGQNNTGPALDAEFAIVPLLVGGGDITGLRIATGRGATLSGRVVFEGTPPAADLRVRVVPQSVDSSRNAQMPGRNAPGDGVVGSDGSFRLDGIAAPTFLRITLEPEGNRGVPNPLGYMTKSVLVDGVDMADMPLDPLRRGSIGNITLVVTDKLTDISGTVSDSRGDPVQGTVLIVPDMLPVGVSPTRFVRVLQSDEHGRFTVRGMPAGRYVGVAVSTFDTAHQYDPDVIQRARQYGRAFAVREGESATVDLAMADAF